MITEAYTQESGQSTISTKLALDTVSVNEIQEGAGLGSFVPTPGF